MVAKPQPKPKSKSSAKPAPKGKRTPKPAPVIAADTSKRLRPKASRVEILPPVDDTLLGGTVHPETAVRDIDLGEILPDPNQPRWILPTDLRRRFFSEAEPDPAAVLREWKKFVTRRQTEHGDQDPYVVDFRKIVDLAESIRAGGQVLPTSVYRLNDVYRIESGERRYWAHAYLVYLEKDDTQRTIPCTIHTDFEPIRQVLENQMHEDLSAVGFARSLARVIAPALSAKDKACLPPVYDYEAYRYIASAHVPDGVWPELMHKLALSMDSLKQYLNLLLLPAEALDLADRYQLTERLMRPLVSKRLRAETAKQIAIVQAVVEYGFTAADVEQLANAPDVEQAIQDLHLQRSSSDAHSTRARTNDAKLLGNRLENLYRTFKGVAKDDRNPWILVANHLIAKYGRSRGLEMLGELMKGLTLTESVLEEATEPNTVPAGSLPDEAAKSPERGGEELAEVAEAEPSDQADQPGNADTPASSPEDSKQPAE